MLNPAITVDLKNWAVGKVNEMIRGGGISHTQVTESKLRSDTLLGTGQSYTDISFQSSKQSPNKSEILLTQNNAFLATMVRLSAKKLTAAPTDALHKKAREFTYPNIFVFDGTNEVTGILALWNAKLSFTQNQAVPFPYIHTGDLLAAPDQIYGDITGLIAGPIYSRKIQDSKQSPNFGFLDIEPILFLGTDQTYANLDLGAAIDITETNEYNYFTIELGGWLISGK